MDKLSIGQRNGKDATVWLRAIRALIDNGYASAYHVVGDTVPDPP